MFCGDVANGLRYRCFLNSGAKCFIYIYMDVYVDCVKYCDMTPESRNSPLLDNGSLRN
jgi:hypothetical protein